MHVEGHLRAKLQDRGVILVWLMADGYSGAEGVPRRPSGGVDQGLPGFFGGGGGGGCAVGVVDGVAAIETGGRLCHGCDDVGIDFGGERFVTPTVTGSQGETAIYKTKSMEMLLCY